MQLRIVPGEKRRVRRFEPATRTRRNDHPSVQPHDRPVRHSPVRRRESCTVGRRTARTPKRCDPRRHPPRHRLGNRASRYRILARPDRPQHPRALSHTRARTRREAQPAGPAGHHNAFRGSPPATEESPFPRLRGRSFTRHHPDATRSRRAESRQAAISSHTLSCGSPCIS